MVTSTCRPSGEVTTNGRHKTPVLLDFSLTVKAAPLECVIRTSQL